MKNYICINGKKIELTAEQIATLTSETKKATLADVATGEVFKIGTHEFIVLEHTSGAVLALKKDIICKMAFGTDNNNYLESKIKPELEKFYGELKAIAGEENIVSHTADLTSDDGLKDYRTFETYVSLLTADMYRKYVQIIDKYKLDCWWWLLTPCSTDTHENSDWVKCVSPLGGIGNDGFNYDDIGVRPFCIFKSNIFVSCEK